MVNIKNINNHISMKYCINLIHQEISILVTHQNSAKVMMTQNSENRLRKDICPGGHVYTPNHYFTTTPTSVILCQARLTIEHNFYYYKL